MVTYTFGPNAKAISYEDITNRVFNELSNVIKPSKVAVRHTTTYQAENAFQKEWMAISFKDASEVLRIETSLYPCGDGEKIFRADCVAMGNIPVYRLIYSDRDFALKNQEPNLSFCPNFNKIYTKMRKMGIEDAVKFNEAFLIGKLKELQKQ